MWEAPTVELRMFAQRSKCSWNSGKTRFKLGIQQKNHPKQQATSAAGVPVIKYPPCATGKVKNRESRAREKSL